MIQLSHPHRQKFISIRSITSLYDNIALYDKIALYENVELFFLLCVIKYIHGFASTVTPIKMQTYSNVQRLVGNTSAPNAKHSHSIIKFNHI